MPVPLRFAIFGCGRMGRQHAARLRADGRGQVTAVVDVDRAAAEELREAVAPEAVAFDDAAALLRSGGFDAAIVCTPTREHFEQALGCLERGVHVLCEKPLADTRERISRLIAAHRGGAANLAVAYQRRSWGTFRALRREVLSGRWGPVRAVASHNVENWQPTIAGTWRDDPRLNRGGFIGDAGSHKIDAAFYVTGLTPVEVFARCDRCGSSVEIAASVSARLAGGVPLTMDFVGHAQYLGEDLHVHCAEADWILRHGEVWLGRDGRIERFTDVPADSSPVPDFLALLEGGPEIAPPECALPVFDFTEAILESSRDRRSVPIPVRET